MTSTGRWAVAGGSPADSAAPSDRLQIGCMCAMERLIHSGISGTFSAEQFQLPN